MQEKTIKDIIGINLKKFRLRAGVTQESLGELINKTGSHISNVESGRNQLDAADFYLVCIALSITYDHLFPAENELPKDVVIMKNRMKLNAAINEADRLGKEYQAKLKEANDLKKQLES